MIYHKVVGGGGGRELQGNILARSRVIVKQDVRMLPVSTIGRDGINRHKSGQGGRIGHHTDDKRTGV